MDSFLNVCRVSFHICDISFNIIFMTLAFHEEIFRLGLNIVISVYLGCLLYVLTVELL